MVKEMGGVAKRPRVHLPDSARLFRGCDVAEPAVLSIGCYFERPADGTAVSLGDAVFPTSQGVLVCVCVCARANFDISNETQVHFIGKQKHRSRRERPAALREQHLCVL